MKRPFGKKCPTCNLAHWGTSASAAARAAEECNNLGEPPQEHQVGEEAWAKFRKKTFAVTVLDTKIVGHKSYNTRSHVRKYQVRVIDARAPRNLTRGSHWVSSKRVISRNI
jgi:hypothetical protein